MALYPTVRKPQIRKGPCLSHPCPGRSLAQEGQEGGSLSHPVPSPAEQHSRPHPAGQSGPPRRAARELAFPGGLLYPRHCAASFPTHNSPRRLVLLCSSSHDTDKKTEVQRLRDGPKVPELPPGGAETHTQAGNSPCSVLPWATRAGGAIWEVEGEETGLSFGLSFSPCYMLETSPHRGQARPQPGGPRVRAGSRYEPTRWA